MQLEGELDPANCLIDRYMQMLDGNVLEWVPWEEAPRRDQEITHQSSRKKWMADSSGVVKERAVRVGPHADVSSALRISWALQRRGLALEIAGLMDWESHEKLRLKLLGALTREAPDPRYAPASLDQVRQADKECWRLLSKKCRASLRPASAMDPLPLVAAMDE
eukprot:10805891-Alexandrium_andersonii.AAC.1